MILKITSDNILLSDLIMRGMRMAIGYRSSANEICYQLGFKDPAYFSSFFHRYAQVTPREYRQRQLGLH